MLIAAFLAANCAFTTINDPYPPEKTASSMESIPPLRAQVRRNFPPVSEVISLPSGWSDASGNPVGGNEG
ncbi:MAG: hypothetical protein M0P13_09565 [Fibrobacteraceae bacterium]|nr:hypothetical protein [Fibrobacteraceae bacterium]